MLIDPTNIVGANEIAKRLNRAHQTIVHAWHTRHEDFPKPIAVITAGKLWNWEEIKQWAERTGRLEPCTLSE